tara:strand:+ start:1552 stop:2502 length:951 start_codon:yes stop_codon:yes gene_type:complete
MKIKINKKITEMSSMGGGLAQGHVDNYRKDLKEEEFPEKVHKKARYIQDKEGKPRDQAYAIAINMHKDGKLEELYSTSGINMMGAGLKQIDPTPEQENERYDMNYINKGLQNYKPNHYFLEDKQKKTKIKIKIKRNLEERCQKGYKTHPTRKTKKMFGKTYRNCVKAEGKMSKSYCKSTPCDEMGFSQRASCAKYKKCPSPKNKNEAKDPKKGTGKKPKGSGRRLYTDENPKDTVGVKFSTVQDVKDTFSKASFKSKSHKRQSQIINLVHQRARAAYQNAKDPEVKKRLKKSFDYAKKRKEASKRKTKRMNKAKKN